MSIRTESRLDPADLPEMIGVRGFTPAVSDVFVMRSCGIPSRKVADATCRSKSTINFHSCDLRTSGIPEQVKGRSFVYLTRQAIIEGQIEASEGKAAMAMWLGDCPKPELTERQNQIMLLRCLGYPSSEVKDILKCEKSTVNFHIGGIHERWAVSNQREMLWRALLLGRDDVLRPEEEIVAQIKLEVLMPEAARKLHVTRNVHIDILRILDEPLERAVQALKSGDDGDRKLLFEGRLRDNFDLVLYSSRALRDLRVKERLDASEIEEISLLLQNHLVHCKCLAEGGAISADDGIASALQKLTQEFRKD